MAHTTGGGSDAPGYLPHFFLVGDVDGHLKVAGLVSVRGLHSDSVVIVAPRLIARGVAMKAEHAVLVNL